MDAVDPKHHHVGLRQLELVVRQSADLQQVPPQVASDSELTWWKLRSFELSFNIIIVVIICYNTNKSGYIWLLAIV